MRIRRVSGAFLAAVLAAAASLTVSGAEPSDLFGDPTTTDPLSPPTTTPWGPESDVSYHPDDVAALADEEGVTLEEAELRLRLETAAMALEPSLSENWPDTYGGAWLRTNGPAGLVVAFTKGAEANQAVLRADFEFPELLHTQTVERSLAELEAQLSRMIEERDQLLAGKRPSGISDAIAATGGSYSLGIRYSENAVMVYLPDVTADLRSGFNESYGDAVVLEARDIQPVACSRTDCRYELRGGLKIEHSTYCSSAFAAKSPNNYYLLSAGHCDGEGSGQDRSHAGEWFGYVTLDAVGGYADAERIYRPWPSQWYVGASIFVEAGDIRPIYYHISWSNTMEGTWIGKAGARTGVTRGYIIDKTYSPWWVSGSSRFIMGDFCARPGDSGGSVFRGNTAYGIVSGGTAECTADSVMVFGNIVYALDAVNLELLASP